MLSRVITSCGGMSMATTRSETVWTLVSSGGRNRNPGPFAPHERPRTNSTPRSYSLNTFRPDRTYKNTMPRAAGSARSMSVPSGGERFHDHRRALAAADAGGAEAEALLGAAQRMEQVDRDASAGRGQRVADGDGAAVHVRLRAVEPQLLLDGEILRGEGLIHLHQVHLLELHAGLLERLARGGRRADPHVLGLDARHGPGHDPAQRLQAVRLGVRVARDHRRGRAVHDPRRVARGDEPILLEVRLEGEQHLERRAGPHVLVGTILGRLSLPALYRHRDHFILEHTLVPGALGTRDRKSTRLNSSHVEISYAVFCLKKKNSNQHLNHTTKTNHII